MNEVFEELRAALHSIWHRRWIVLGVTWAVCLAGWLAVALIPNAYESKARIFVQLDDVLSEQIGIAGGSAKAIERVRQTLTSAVNLEKVVRSTRLGDEVTVKRFRRNKHLIELHAENPDYPTIVVEPGEPFEIEGLAVGLIRNTMLM